MTTTVDTITDALTVNQRAAYSAQLRDAQIAFQAAGGRGVEEAEEIDRLIALLQGHPDYRVRIVLDESANVPYDNGSSPIIYFDLGNAYQVRHTTSYVLDDRLIAAANRWSDEPEMFERYARIFHGATAFEWYTTQDTRTYVTFDPADWREMVNDLLEPASTVSMSEYRAYLEGEVYGIELEREVTWARLNRNPPELWPPTWTVDWESMRETWEEVESVYGFYGLEYAKEQARQMLHEATEQED